MRVLFREMIEQFLPAFRNLCLFILEYEVITSDNDLLAIQVEEIP